MQLQEFHRRLNAERFGGALGPIAVRVSRRMRSRLGHYAPAQRGAPAEIAISARHVKRHGFEQALQTLLHEMVHQWQDESKLPLDHGAEFREKASEVGITARATRTVDRNSKSVTTEDTDGAGGSRKNTWGYCARRWCSSAGSTVAVSLRVFRVLRGNAFAVEPAHNRGYL